MYTHNSGIRWLTAGLMIAAVSFPAAAAARYAVDVQGSPTGTPSCELLRAVQHRDTRFCNQPLRHRPRKPANHKVTTPESVGVNDTGVPAGGF